MNFTQATQHCRSIDAILAEPRTLDEHDIVHDYIIPFGNKFIWLGNSDSETEGNWLWQSDGHETLSYDKWGTGFPRDGENDCLLMSPNTGLYYDRLCSYNNYFLCQTKGNFFLF